MSHVLFENPLTKAKKAACHDLNDKNLLDHHTWSGKPDRTTRLSDRVDWKTLSRYQYFETNVKRHCNCVYEISDLTTKPKSAVPQSILPEQQISFFLAGKYARLEI